MAGTSITGKPSTLTSYEPITITNTQSSATPSPFQQMVNFTSSDPGWTSISTSNFGQNVEFFYYNGTVIPSWLENYTSSHALWWLKIAAIPAGSSETVYVGFAPTTTNLFNTVNDGEAPQIPCGSTPTSSCSNYAEYDDGANVFNNYWNFAGTTPSYSTFGNWYGSQNNELSISASSDFGGVYYSISSVTAIIAEAHLSIPSTSAQIAIILSSSNSGTSSTLMYPSYDFGYASWDGQTGQIDYTPNSITVDRTNPSSALPTPTNTFVVMGFAVTASSQNAQINYNSYISTTYTGVSPFTYLMIGSWDNSGTVQWLRTRAYPPNGVMPSVSFGSVA